MAEVPGSETWSRSRVRDRQAAHTPEAFDEPLIVTSYTSSSAPREVPRAALAGAVMSWFALVFAVCYVVLPVMAAVFGLYDGVIRNLLPNTLAFVPLAILTTALAAMVRPRVITRIGAPRDPVVSAAFGSFLVWALGHEALTALQPISQMGAIEAVTFAGINVVEHGLFGLMLGSFVRTPLQAFALGVAFQAMFLSLFVGWLF
jgi:hypothetical protein